MPVPRRTGPRIAVVGSYATGLTMKVERMPSTGETLLGTGYRVDYGGKGSNQAVACARLGAQGEGWGLDAAAGAYGCRNTETGNTVICEANGLCTDYSGDPRWKRIQEILKGSPARRSPMLTPPVRAA